MLDVHILMTMDVEPVKRDTQWSGPENLEGSERSIQGFWNAAQRHGYPVSFFLHPETAQAHAALFTDLRHRGAALGLHLHPTKFQYPRWDRELGGFSADEQRVLIGEAKQIWSQALTQEPLYFRPGAFSANDATFGVLADLGFRGGCVSIPGRVWRRRYCLWAGAELHPHRTHRYFRQLSGDMEFADIPLSVNYRMPMEGPGYTYFQDLRPDARGVPVQDILRGIVEQIANDRPRVAAISLVTHNDQPYDNPAHESCLRYHEVLSSVAPLCDEFGLKAIGGTVEDVCKRVLSLPPQPRLVWKGVCNISGNPADAFTNHNGTKNTT